jgi:hypothetical protein
MFLRCQCHRSRPLKPILASPPSPTQEDVYGHFLGSPQSSHNQAVGERTKLDYSYFSDTLAEEEAAPAITTNWCHTIIFISAIIHAEASHLSTFANDGLNSISIQRRLPEDS